MKMIIAIVQDDDEQALGEAFMQADIKATKLSSTGGFLRAGNTTFLVGCRECDVDRILAIIKDSSQERQQVVATPTSFDIDYGMAQSFPTEVAVGGAIVFVLPVDEFHRF
ncbi:cyclic-di-AMP receptor [Hutsoniella sourekii]|uniref:cyclic-di-AMP receptor n=1 Tax=Hutsoniella sourekii TaxID=87650 RepID=UPI000488FA74|nr:cyclic-di-AMP receptor [Hutsoniella sourekii]